MEYKFDKNNKDKIASFLEVKDKCFYYEEKLLGNLFQINNNNWKFIYYHSFFSLIRDVSDLSLFFLINEEISNSIERKPYPDLIIDIITNGHYKNSITINEKKIDFNINKIKQTTDELKELLVWKYNEILGSQLLDFSTSIFSAFEFWISKLYEKYCNEIKEKMLNSRKQKYKKLIDKYNLLDENEEEKDKILIKIIKAQGIYFSFPDKLNSIFKVINKEKYTQSRNIQKDKDLIDFLRASRNTIHNTGIHIGKNLNFEFNGTIYKLLNNKPQFIQNHSDMILMYGELIDIYANILYSIEDIEIQVYIKEEQSEQDLNIFNMMINGYVLDKNNLNQEEQELVFSNFKKIIPNEDKVIKLLDFLGNMQDINENDLLLKTLCADFN